jgi:hypothetical protein
MAIRISSVIQNGGRDDDRLSGFVKDASAPFFIGGMVVTQKAPDATGAGKNMTYFNGAAVISATNPRPLGLVIEPTTGYPNIAANNDQGAGLGFDTQDYAKGGLYSAFHRPGNLVDVFDDLRDRTQVVIAATPQNKSCPFVSARTWAVGDTVYACDPAVGQAGLLDNVASPAGSARVGTVRSVTNAGLGTPMLTIELAIDVI